MTGATVLSNTVARLLPARWSKNGLTRSVFALFSIVVVFFFVSVIILHQRSAVGSSSTPIPDRYNLMDSWQTKINGNVECTLGILKESMNTYKMAQDHPCVIEMIRRNYLDEPSPSDAPYQLDQPRYALVDSSQGQIPVILDLLKNKVEGFFVECGANDGETLSNTLYLESQMKWSGLLIEADVRSYQKLSDSNRKAWKAPVCLSLEPYPTEVTFQPSDGMIVFLSMADKEWSESKKKTWWDKRVGNDVTVQCFPLYSLLLALNRTTVDFFSLDIDGHEVKVLKTIPWHKLDIKTVTVETVLMDKEHELEDFVSFMESSGFRKAKELYLEEVQSRTKLPLDIIFINKKLMQLN